MGQHDQYGKRIPSLACGEDFSEWRGAEFALGGGAVARIDGTVGGSIAVEVESRTPKQVRGAMLDLILHPYPKKLLVLIPAYLGNSSTALAMSQHVLGKLLDGKDFRVVLVAGTGDAPREANDVQLVRVAASGLGWGVVV
jgi:hypothetical protein